MSEITVVIIDDEAPARDILKHYLKSHAGIKLVEECSDGFAGLKAIREHNPDLVLLDIQMPRLNGFEMLEVMDGNPAIIFTTAYDQYALKAFEMNAIDYLLKPVSAERFSSAVEKALAALPADRKAREQPGALLENRPPGSPALTRIVVKKGNGINIIPVDELRYLEAQDDYVMIHHSSGKALKQQRMKYYEECLPAAKFARIHRSYIVKITEICRLEPYGKDTYIAILKDGKRIPVSRAGYRNLKDEFSL